MDMQELARIDAACAISVPRDQMKTIAIVGAGVIVDYAHLPAYKLLNLPVKGVNDLIRDKAEDVARRHNLPHVYGSFEEILADPEVDIVDFAIMPQDQPAMAEAAMKAGKHVLCQKPLAFKHDDAMRIVRAAGDYNRKAAVNQQLRYDEGVAVAREMIRRGYVGDVVNVKFGINLKTAWSAWPWLLESDRLDLYFHSLHYLDAIRSILGNPERVWCMGNRSPGQEPRGETYTMSILFYPGNTRGIVNTNHENPGQDNEAVFRIEGTRGAIRGTLGLLYNYPEGRPDTLELRSDVVPTDGWLSYPISRRWLPHAFAGPMASLMRSISDDSEPMPSAADNVNTIRLIERLYQSMDSERVEPVEPAGVS